jgi:hypothetical protein
VGEWCGRRWDGGDAVPLPPRPLAVLCRRAVAPALLLLLPPLLCLAVLALIPILSRGCPAGLPSTAARTTRGRTAKSAGIEVVVPPVLTPEWLLPL